MISAIVPTLDAAERLPQCLAALVPGLVDGVLAEAVVVDGGSRDASREIATDMGCRVLDSPPGRAGQLLAGIAAARHDWLLILHGDTVLQDGWVAACHAHISSVAHASGATRPAGWFRLAFDDSSVAARFVAAGANWRSRVLGLPYGDQGLLIHKATLAGAGGLAALPFLEDLDLVRRLGRHRLRELPAMAITSARRFRRDGWLRRSSRNLMIVGAFLAGVPASRLMGLYR
jgi:rSAM/selenodomain-associated transferase 2